MRPIRLTLKRLWSLTPEGKLLTSRLRSTPEFLAFMGIQVREKPPFLMELHLLSLGSHPALKGRLMTCLV